MLTSYLRLPDGTNWPNPDDPTEIQWTLRYGNPEQKLAVALSAASVLGAYNYLIDMPQKARDARIQQIKAARDEQAT